MPLSPSISTVRSVGAPRRATSRVRTKAWLEPTSSSKPVTRDASSVATRCWSRRRSRARSTTISISEIFSGLVKKSYAPRRSASVAARRTV